MSTEIERKYLVHGDSWRKNADGVPYRQGFLSTDKERVVRVRIAGAKAFLTVKGISRGIRRTEFEYPIPISDAEKMLDELCQKPLIEKTRYRVEHDHLVWEIDEFHGVNEGLIIAEVELSNETQEFDVPNWIGEEVSNDARYFNANLISLPYSKW